MEADAQSERQFGAFLFLYLVNEGTPFRTGKELATYDTKFGFRNKVIHAGYFPSRKEVLEFARYVYDLIVEVRDSIIKRDAETVRKG